MRPEKKLLVGAATTLVIGLVHMFLVEPSWLEVTHHLLPSKVNAPLKIAHLTDLHIEKTGRLEQRVLAVLAEESPDIVLLTGDYVAAGGNYAAALKFLSQLSAPLGVWGVDGNWEHWTGNTGEGSVVANGSNLVMLRNQSRRIRADLWIVGVDDAVAGKPDMESAFREMPAGAFCIALFHSPSYFPLMVGKCPLNLAGHTHGGQIRLPWVKPFWLPAGSGPFVSGWYDGEGSMLYVNRGLGTSILPARLFARPEVAIIQLEPKK